MHTSMFMQNISTACLRHVMFAGVRGHKQSSSGRAKPHEPAKESAGVATTAPKRGPGRPRKSAIEGVQKHPAKAQAVHPAPKRGAKPRKCKGKKRAASPDYMYSDDEQYCSEVATEAVVIVSVVVNVIVTVKVRLQENVLLMWKRNAWPHDNVIALSME